MRDSEFRGIPETDGLLGTKEEETMEPFLGGDSDLGGGRLL